MVMPRKNVDTVPMRGGVDLSSTVVEVPPGTALDLLNFEPKLGGGYQRVSGYERVDGRAAPSDAVYYTVEVADSSGIAIGATLLGGSSTTTSEVVAKDDTMNLLGVTALSAPGYTLSEAANGTTITAVEVLSGQDDNDLDNEWQLAAENYYRNLIAAPAGTGSAVYAFQRDTTKYAFRESGGTLVLYSSSTSGWTVVPYYRVMFFDTGVLNDGDVVVGDTLDGLTSGAQGTVKSIVKNGGDYGSTASGYVVLDVTSGVFQSGEAIQESAVTRFTSTSTADPITMATGGFFQHIEHNFYGTASTRRIYGCDGVNPAWEFDGDALVPIYFPDPTPNPAWNKPTHIESHRSALWLMFETGRVAISAPGIPLSLSGLQGAAEFGLGDQPTGIKARAGDVLAIYTRNKAYGMYGTSTDGFELRVISETFGAKPYTVDSVGTVYAFDDKGIVPLERVQAYGDFEGATISRSVKEILDFYKDSIVTAGVVREKNQYRLYFDDGTFLIMVFDTYVGSEYPDFSLGRYNDAPVFVSSSEDENGNEVILFGDSSGMIYQAERGYNFDGDAIEFACRTTFIHSGSPHLRKSYRRLYADIEAERNLDIAVSFELSYGDFYKPANNANNPSFSGGGGYFDVNLWDVAYWDAELFSSRGIPLSGTGNNISVLFYGNSNLIRPFTIQTVELHYFPRRTKRDT